MSLQTVEADNIFSCRLWKITPTKLMGYKYSYKPVETTRLANTAKAIYSSYLTVGGLQMDKRLNM